MFISFLIFQCRVAVEIDISLSYYSQRSSTFCLDESFLKQIYMYYILYWLHIPQKL
jgi:hypothetical protein